MDYGDGHGGIPGGQDKGGVANVDIDDRFLQHSYRFRQQWWSLWGQRIVVTDDYNHEVFHIYQKAMRLREDLRIYGDRQHTEELLHIQARQIIDFSAAYDVRDSRTQIYVGTIRRQGLRSLARDSWQILNLNQQVIATVSEDNLGCAIARRVAFGALIPATFDIRNQLGVQLATAYTRFNLFIQVMDLLIERQSGPREIDPRLLIATTVLLSLVEGKQHSY